MRLKNIWGHFKTVRKHRRLVFRHCRACGLFWQGLRHDLSKYSPEEFSAGVRYFQGDRSPNDAQRQETGYSYAWLHHKGRNKHHLEYWIDYRKEDAVYAGLPMPLPYLAESVCDRIAACKVYRGDDYTNDCALNYYLNSRPHYLVHEETDALFLKYLGILAEEGEDACFRRLKEDLSRYKAEKKKHS